MKIKNIIVIITLLILSSAITGCSSATDSNIDIKQHTDSFVAITAPNNTNNDETQNNTDDENQYHLAINDIPEGYDTSIQDILIDTHKIDDINREDEEVIAQLNELTLPSKDEIQSDIIDYCVSDGLIPQSIYDDILKELEKICINNGYKVCEIIEIYEDTSTLNYTFNLDGNKYFLYVYLDTGNILVLK